MTLRALSILLLLPLVACGSPAERGIGFPRPSDDPRQDLASGTEQRARVTIALLEDARTDGDGYLQLLAGHRSPEIRARAALALGRLPRAQFGASVTEVLARKLTDKESHVRKSAAFALGMRGGAAVRELRQAASDDSPAVRAVAIEALSKIPNRATNALVLGGLADAALEARCAAAIGPHRWARSDEDAGEVDEALIAAFTVDQHAIVLWRILFTLQRRRAPAALSTFRNVLANGTGSELERLYAAKGLANLIADGHAAYDADLARLLANVATGDVDLRVRVEALRAIAQASEDVRGGGADVATVPALVRAAQDDSFHVRAAACEALGEFSGSDATQAVMARLADKSLTVRVAALRAHAKRAGVESIREIIAFMQSDDTVLRNGAARACAQLPAEQALPLLLESSRDEHPLVVGTALAGLGSAPDRRAGTRLREFVTGDDNGLRVAAIDALLERLRPEDVRLLRASFETARGDIANEVRVSALRAASKLGTDEALALLEQGLANEHPFVAQVAYDALVEHGRTEHRPRYDTDRQTHVPLPGVDYDPAARPRVEIVTSRGSLRFELFPAEAPVHVHSFLRLAKKGHYDGLGFHRVVSDFVIQGGCYRGDGAGSGTWRGPDDALRQEIGMRKYVRGSLGMPRNEDLESGGNQIFVNHRATPHLDGRYTIFGELREGFDVLDAIEVGDTILTVRVL